ncbi:MAG: hypothetical protein HYT40_02845 [Candidatus Sungbacteria bacterium]|uniref:DUF5671 domain-containing protein n=1 Tax=Candidatus Sungiibacteriota bacterium TaxID=2750080 RepID=A0A931WN88_9BACT|nr:hypothetical protein [Candidatus Sungbacteria bacterium]
METEVSQKISPKNVFLNLVGIIALYISAGSLIALLFQYINYFFPDLLAYQSLSYGTLRWAIAALLIIFPVYIIASWLLQREYAANPEERERRLRKWIIYFTLFLAAVMVIIDLVALVYFFLEGSITTAFLLKVLAVFLVGGTVFWHYFSEIRRSASALPGYTKTFAWVAVLIIGAIIIGGFFIAGSPFAERLRKFDERRVSDLQTIQGGIVGYWQKKDVLPATLNDLKDDISGFVAPLDPESGTPYEYRSTGNLSFELCATFNAPINANTRMAKPVPAEFGGMGENWDHEAGRQCFLRTIDPQIYGIPKDLKLPR